MPDYELEGLKCSHMSPSSKSSRETEISGRGIGCTAEKLQLDSIQTSPAKAQTEFPYKPENNAAGFPQTAKVLSALTHRHALWVVFFILAFLLLRVFYVCLFTQNNIAVSKASSEQDDMTDYRDINQAI